MVALPRRGPPLRGAVIDAVRRGRALPQAPTAPPDRNEPIARHPTPRRVPVPEVKLTAESRTEFGKGAARRLRRAHKIPAVLYGHGTQPVHVTLPGHATMLALKHSNTLLTLELDGGSTTLALPKDVQRHPVRREIEHVDLLIVRRGEKVTVDVPLHLVGESAPGVIPNVELNTLPLLVEATSIPGSVQLSIEGAEAGTQYHAGQIPLPAGATLAGDPEALAVVLTAVEAEPEEEQAPEGDVVAEAGTTS
jgi:large subunit ribosomal protein L25